MGNVLGFQPRSAGKFFKLQCPKCFVEQEAGCNCGVAYVPAGKLADQLVAANPDMGAREIAREFGIPKSTVAKARQRLSVPKGTVKPIGRPAKSSKKAYPIKPRADTNWPDGDAPKPEFDRQVFLFGARDATELGKNVLADISDAEFDDYRALEAAAKAVIVTWQSVLTRLLKHKEKSNG